MLRVDPATGKTLSESSRVCAPGKVKPEAVGADVFGDWGSRGETEGRWGSGW